MTAEKTMTHLDHVTSVPTLSSLRDTDRTISSSDQDIRGRMVKDKDGRDLGRIEDLLVDDIERKVRFMEVATGGFLGFGESKSFIPIDAITRMTPDEVYISHTREHVAGAPRYDPALVPSDLHYFFNLYPYYGYPASFGLFPQPLASPEVTSDATAAIRTGA